MQQGKADITQKLISRAGAYHEDAVSALVEYTWPKVYCSIKAMVRDENVTRELLRDTYVTGMQGLRMLREPKEFPNWIRMVAHSETISWLAGRMPTLFSRMLIDHEEGQEFDDEYPPTLPQIEMEERVAETLLMDLMRMLPEDQRVCLVLYYYERKSVDEIARELGISPDSVRSRLNYSKWKIKARVREWERNDVNLYGFKTRYAISFMVFLFRKYEEICLGKKVPAGMIQGIMTELKQAGYQETAEEQPDEEDDDEAAADIAALRKKKKRQTAALKRRRRRIGVALALTALVVLLAAAVGLLAIRAHKLQKQIGQDASSTAGAGAQAGGNTDAEAGTQDTENGASGEENQINTEWMNLDGNQAVLPDEKFIAGTYCEKEHENWMEITGGEDDAYEVTFHSKDAKGKEVTDTYQAKADGSQLLVDSGTGSGTAATLRWVNEYTVSVNASSFFETEKKITVGGVYLNNATPLRGGSGIDAYLGSWVGMDDANVTITMQMSAGALHMVLTAGGETKIDHTYTAFEVEQGVNGLPSKLRAHQSAGEDETYWLYPDGTITFHAVDSEYSGKNFKWDE